MYMKVCYYLNPITPHPGDEVPGVYDPPHSLRGSSGFTKQGLNPVD